MINIYEYNIIRNKFGQKGKLPSNLKKEIIQKKGKKCYLCQNEKSKSELELEHKIPVMALGHLFDKDNLDIACKKCHREKTNQDIKAINILKKIGIIKTNFGINSFYPRNEIIEIFNYFKELIIFEENMNKIYDFGKNGQDYQQVFDDSNRKPHEKKEDLLVRYEPKASQIYPKISQIYPKKRAKKQELLQNSQKKGDFYEK